MAVGNNIDLASFLGEVVNDQSLENLKRALDKIGLFVGGRVNAEALDEVRLSILPCLQSAWQPDQPLEVALGRLCRSEVNLRLNDRLRTGLGDEPVVAAQKMDGDVGLLEIVAHSLLHLRGVQRQMIVRQDDMAPLAQVTCDVFTVGHPVGGHCSEVNRLGTQFRSRLGQARIVAAT